MTNPTGSQCIAPIRFRIHATTLHDARARSLLGKGSRHAQPHATHQTSPQASHATAQHSHHETHESHQKTATHAITLAHGTGTLHLSCF